jgi:preprotein translocase subunit SecA
LVRISIGEFLAEDIDLGTGTVVEATSAGSDWQGLVNWVNGHFSIGLKIEDICDLPRDEIIRSVEAAAEAATEAIDLAPLDTFLIENYPHVELAKWVGARFGEDLAPDVFTDVQGPAEAVEVIIGVAHDLYHRRERFYPIDFAIEMTTVGLKQDPQQALSKFCGWVRARYELDWTPETLPSANPADIRAAVAKEAERWDDARIEDRARRLVDGVDTVDALDERLKDQLGASFFDKEREAAELDMVGATVAKIKAVMRMEVEQLERWVLLQIVDAAWKEHLHQMDQLREAIGYRSFSQRDPRIEFKREGAQLYDTMQEGIRDRLVDMVFKVRMSPQAAPHPDQGEGQPQPSGANADQASQRRPSAPQAPADPAQAAVRAAAAVASGAGTAQRNEARSRRPSPAAPLTVGRNEPCPCGSGKKYKKCCGVK